MALILNIESSGPVCSVCVSKGKEILSAKATEKPFQHTEQITLLIEDCVKETGMTLRDIDAVAISSGPGSYTALRVGTATAKGICYALNKPLISIDTLSSLAGAAIKSFTDDAYYVPMIDARRMEVYTNVFNNNNIPQTETQALIVTAETHAAFPQDDKKVYLFGNGAKKCLELLPEPRFKFIEVTLSAANLVVPALAKFQQKAFADLAYFSPFYLKSPNITKAKPKL
jgi:tRNA threonylcarbamoyladenosine biosynthesis protein TsaB